MTLDLPGAPHRVSDPKEKQRNAKLTLSGDFWRELSRFVMHDKGRSTGEMESRRDAYFGDAGIEQVDEIRRRERRRRHRNDDALYVMSVE